MKKNNLNFLAILFLASFILGACSLSSNSVVGNKSFLQKRKHNKGWHISIASNNTSNDYLAENTTPRIIPNSRIANKNCLSKASESNNITHSNASSLRTEKVLINNQAIGNVNELKEQATINRRFKNQFNNKEEINLKLNIFKGENLFWLNNKEANYLSNSNQQQQHKGGNRGLISSLILIVICLNWPPLAILLYTKNVNQAFVSLLLITAVSFFLFEELLLLAILFQIITFVHVFSVVL